MCLGCRYDVSGMDIRAKCPECGDRVAPSVNNIALESADHKLLATLNGSTRAITKAGVLALIGLALLCLGYGFRGGGVGSQAPMFGTLFGSSTLLVTTFLAAQQMRVLGSHRIPGEDPKAKSFRAVLRGAAIFVVAYALLSAAVLVLLVSGRISLSQHRAIEYVFTMWILFLFVPIYVCFYLHSLAQRSRSLKPKLLMSLAIAGMFVMIPLPAATGPADESILLLLGLSGSQPSSFPRLLPINPPYVWPIAMAWCIIVMLVAIAYFRRGLGFAEPIDSDVDPKMSGA